MVRGGWEMKVCGREGKERQREGGGRKGGRRGRACEGEGEMESEEGALGLQTS